MKKIVFVLLVFFTTCSEKLINFGGNDSYIEIKKSEKNCNNFNSNECFTLYYYTAVYYCGNDMLSDKVCFNEINFTSNQAYVVGQKLKVNLEIIHDEKNNR
jgi:hypothetical protein